MRKRKIGTALFVAAAVILPILAIKYFEGRK
jgi:hypothetical protein